jgi:hypothetical protein
MTFFFLEFIPANTIATPGAIPPYAAVLVASIRCSVCDKAAAKERI